MPDLVSEVGAADANSYVDADEAAAYFAARLHSGAWDDADPDDQARALITAAGRLDQQTYSGRPATTTQALAWPRSGARDRNDAVVPADAIPVQVRRAQMELAIAYLTGEDDPLADSGLEGIESVRIGPLGVDVRPRPAGKLPAVVRRLLSPFLVDSGLTFRMERS